MAGLRQSHSEVTKKKETRDAPTYFIKEAATYLWLAPPTVRSWAVGRQYPTGVGPRQFKPVIKIADHENQLLSFNNLVELHILSSIRRTHNVKLDAIRRAVKYLHEEFGTEHPLLDDQMQTDGKSLFVQRYGQLVNASEHGQTEMEHLLELYLKRVERDGSGFPIRLFPFSTQGGEIEAAPKIISIDPSVRFGKPCIAGTGIPTRIITERYFAGDQVSLLAEDYGRSIQEIEEAIRYESRIAS